MTQEEAAGTRPNTDRAAKPKKLRAAIIADGDPLDPNLWSGTPSHMLAALAERFELVLVVRRPWARWFQPVGRLIKAASLRRFEYRWSPWFARAGAAASIKAVRAAAPDVVFAIALTDLAYLLPAEVPLVYVTDALIPDMVNYYEMHRAMPSSAKRGAETAERTALSRAILAQFPSCWASESATRHYGVSPAHIAEVAWGANMPLVVRSPRHVRPQVRLLFIGTDWERKGGPLAIETVAALVARGVDCRIDIVGCTAESLNSQAPAFATFHGFADKRTVAGKALLDRLYAEASLFFLPTRAEAYGIVFAEAAHHGLPVVSHATGGVPSVVRDGVSGVLLPIDAAADDFADVIQGLIDTPERYAAMSIAALANARNRLNWGVWAEQVERAVRVTLAAA